MKPVYRQTVLTCWEMQDQGKTFTEIALATWPMFLAALPPKARARTENAINNATDDRAKVIVQWLKGTLDNVILAVGKMGLRDKYLESSSRFTQGRCHELMRAKKFDEQGTGWSKETGGLEFNNVLAKFNREDNLPEEMPTVKAKNLTLIKDSRVAMVTFGGKQFWSAKKDEIFFFDTLLEKNGSYTIVQSGLNYYVFETNAVI